MFPDPSKRLQPAEAEVERLENNITLALMILKDFYTPDEYDQMSRALIEGVGP